MPTIQFTHTQTSIEVSAGTQFLEACESQDAPMDFGCQSGACGVCTLVVEEGAENLNVATPEELEVAELYSSDAGARLGCQMVVNGDVRVRPAQS